MINKMQNERGIDGAISGNDKNHFSFGGVDLDSLFMHRVFEARYNYLIIKVNY